ncbi:MAG TPA: ATP-binding protein [Bryobacteraceae bacterium]|nr:ATP-binding protein [Bryobacteraceae bacterium]
MNDSILHRLDPRRYLVAGLSVLLAIAIVEALHPWAEQHLPPAVLLPSILLGAWYGGFSAGLLTTVLNGLAAAYFLVPPLHSFRVSEPSGWAYLAALGFQGVLISWLCESRRRSVAARARAISEAQQARAEAQARARELAHVKANLTHLTSAVVDQEQNTRCTPALTASLACYCRVASATPLRSPVPMRSLVQTVATVFANELADVGATVECGALPLVDGDEAQLLSLFHELIENAVKFRRDEPLRVRITAEERKEQCIVSVDDNGMGIVPAYWDQVFVLGRRLHGGGYAGAGVGLAMAKLIVENHGGRIWLHSQAGQGTTVRFSLPRRAV